MRSSLLGTDALRFLLQALDNVFLHLYQISTLPVFFLQCFLDFLCNSTSRLSRSTVTPTCRFADMSLHRTSNFCTRRDCNAGHRSAISKAPSSQDQGPVCDVPCHTQRNLQIVRPTRICFLILLHCSSCLAFLWCPDWISAQHKNCCT